MNTQQYIVRQKLIESFTNYLTESKVHPELLPRTKFIIKEIMKRSLIFKLTSVQPLNETSGVVYFQTDKISEPKINPNNILKSGEYDGLGVFQVFDIGRRFGKPVTDYVSSNYTIDSCLAKTEVYMLDEVEPNDNLGDYINNLIDSFVTTIDRELLKFIEDNNIQVTNYNPDKYFKSNIVTAIYQPLVETINVENDKEKYWCIALKFKHIK